MKKLRERPTRRVNPSGTVVWISRVTTPEGKRVIYKPAWNRGRGTFDRRGDCQAAIDEYYEQGQQYSEQMTLSAYFATWTARHPRSERTNTTNECRIKNVLQLHVGGKPLGDWRCMDLRRKHALELVGAMLTEQKRATTGAQNILRSLSAMMEDAVTDEVAIANFVRGVKVRQNDPRAVKARREPRILSFEEMHAFARCAGKHEALVRVFSDCGPRLGEVLGLERRDFDGAYLNLRGSAHNGVFVPGDQPTKRHVRRVPVPPSLAAMLAELPARFDTKLMFPTPNGALWWERNFKRDVWYPAQERWAGIDPKLPRKERRRLVSEGGFDIRPHDFRHSWVSHMRASGIDRADLAAIAGHSVEVAERYTHSLGRSDELVRAVVG